jgi:hypothetical protein
VSFNDPTPLKPNIGIPDWNARDGYSRGQNKYTPVWAPVEGGFKFNWSVTQGEIAPFILFMSGQVKIDWTGTELGVSGPNNPVLPMEDRVVFRVGQRETTLFCSPTPPLTTPKDQSCDLDAGTYQRDANNQFIYNPGTWMTSTSLISRDQQQRIIIRGYQWFIPTASSARVE